MPMCKVFQLVKTDNSDTIEALTYLLAQARLGRLRGVALCYQDAKGEDGAVFTGLYRAHPEKAVNAAMRLSWRLTQIQDEPQ